MSNVAVKLSTKLPDGDGPDVYFHADENSRREIQGLELLPELPYTEEDHEDDERTLEENIPALRQDPGWQTEEARVFLDDWERETRQRIDDYERNEA